MKQIFTLRIVFLAGKPTVSVSFYNSDEAKGKNITSASQTEAFDKGPLSKDFT